MWKLAIENDEGQQKSLALLQGECTIGRAATCTIRLDERNVSRAHCTLRKVGDSWELRDDQSYNGTYVNGQRVIEPCPIAVGDIVHLGDFRLELLNEAAIQARASEDDGVESSRQRRPARLVMVLGPTPGQEFPLEGERKTIGRGEPCDIVVDDPSVSPLHCELLSMGGGRWEVVEQDGSSGMRVNGLALRRSIIESGDALELGDVRLRFVGEGKFFRPATGGSIAAGALPFGPAALPGSGTATIVTERREGMRRWLVGGAIIGIVMVVAGFLLMATGRGDTSRAEQPVVESESEARGVLEDAVKYAKDDLELAHKLLKRIPEESPVRSDDAFREIEDRWAQAMIARALDSEDKDEATRLLNEVAYTDTVSTERRYQAIDILEDMGVRDLPSLSVARPRKARKARSGASAAPEDIYEDPEAKPKEPSDEASPGEDLYEAPASPRPTPPREDVYEDLDPSPAPKRPPPPAAGSDLYE